MTQETATTESGTALKQSSADFKMARAKELDSTLLETLKKQLTSGSTHSKSDSATKSGSATVEFRNPRVAEAYRQWTATLDSSNNLSDRAPQLTVGTSLFDICYQEIPWRDIDGSTTTLTIARAALTDMWPMGTHYWVRDNALIAARLLGLNEFTEAIPLDLKRGQRVLLSALTVLSSAAQLVRFRAIIANPALAEDANNWPHIFLSISQNLNAGAREEWMHIQDAWQIAVYYALQALDRGLLHFDQLSNAQLELLGLAVPFIARVAFEQRENAGSWEELTAVRSSVICWEAKILEFIASRNEQPEWQFLQEEFKRYETLFYLKENPKCQRGLTHLREALKQLPETASNLTVLATTQLNKGLRVLAKQLPFESPAYDESDPKYREYDAALIYTLHLRTAEQLATHGVISGNEATTLEQQIFEGVCSLQDSVTGAIPRYRNDSYQRSGFFREVTVAKLRELYGGPSGEASGVQAFVERDRLVPKGREAAWCHFVFQLSAYCGRKFLISEEVKWKELHQKFLEQGLALITGDNERSLSEGADGRIEVIDIKAGLLPECYISDLTDDGELMVFPSPHTPLNWASAEAKDACSVACEVLRK